MLCGDVRAVYCEYLANHVQDVKSAALRRACAHTENEISVYALVLGFFDCEITAAHCILERE